MSNAHVATFDATNALVTWEEIADPFCEFIAMGCRGTFTGSYFQLVNSEGTAVGEPLKKTDVTVSGDLVTMNDGRICWPYVNMEWTLDEPVGWGYSSSNVTSMSFACISADGSASSGSSASGAASSTTPKSSSAAVSSPVASSAAPVATSSAAPEVVAAADPTGSVAPVVASPVPTTLATSTTAASGNVEPTPKAPCNRKHGQ